MERIDEGSVEGALNIFSRTARKLNRIKAWHEQKTASGSLGTEFSTTVLDADVAMSGGSINFFNDAWLGEMLGPWDSQYDAGLP